MGSLPLRSLLSMVITRFVVDGTGLGWDIFQSNGFFKVGGARSESFTAAPLPFLSMRTETARAGLPARVAKPCSLSDVGVLEQYRRTCGSSVA